MGRGWIWNNKVSWVRPPNLVQYQVCGGRWLRFVWFLSIWFITNWNKNLVHGTNTLRGGLFHKRVLLTWEVLGACVKWRIYQMRGSQDCGSLSVFQDSMVGGWWPRLSSVSSGCCQAREFWLGHSHKCPSSFFTASPSLPEIVIQ